MSNETIEQRVAPKNGKITAMFNGNQSEKRSDVWETPQWLYEGLDREFGFSLDPCSDGKNAKCKSFYTKETNGLVATWGERAVFMNPPYSNVRGWMKKAYGESQKGSLVVCLVPARTDAHWWHDYAMRGEIRFIRGRIRFGDNVKRLGGSGGAPFPNAIVVFRPPGYSLAKAVV